MDEWWYVVTENPHATLRSYRNMLYGPYKTEDRAQAYRDEIGEGYLVPLPTSNPHKAIEILGGTEPWVE